MAAKVTVMNERAQQLLKALVERYIRDGQPVGSRTLAKDTRLDLSPATIRNVMADLEDMGLLKAPHTSAGRIPTARGYRVFIDSLLTVRPMRSSDVKKLAALLNPDVEPERLIDSACSALSNVTRLAGVIMVPRRDHRALRHVEFLPLSDNRVLAILVLNEREVQNRIIHCSRPYGPAELQEAANYLNRKFIGREPHDVREILLREMQEAREGMNRIMQTAIEMASRAFEVPPRQGGDYVLAGQTNLMSYAEMGDVSRLRQLFEAFNTKRDILHLLDQSLQAEGMQIFIGEESGYQVLDDCSVVTTPYEVDGEVVGVLGVIGPTRMAYDRVIPIVDVTARLLGSALKPN